MTLRDPIITGMMLRSVTAPGLVCLRRAPGASVLSIEIENSP
jgi:hypothetical protein